jgi:hypothetical protein
MRLNLHNFLLENTDYGDGKSARIEALLDAQLKEATEYLFGKKAEQEPLRSGMESLAQTRQPQRM